MEITALEFQRFQTFLKVASGISLADNKQYLVNNRLRPLLNEIGVDELDDLLSLIEAMPDDNLTMKVVEAMTTNETFWFRDSLHFHALEQKVVTELGEKGRISLWSAACSTGQEAFSLSLSIDKALRLINKRPTVQIVATDISEKNIDQAKQGVYTDIQLSRGLPNETKIDHFKGVRGGWQIADKHRSRVSFKSLNLINDFSDVGEFDVVFCRNVLIYFSMSTKIDILNRIAQRMKQGAYLFLSSSEQVPAEVKGLQIVRDSGCKYYRKR
ncbi:MAG: protein-glutamate O-methyltransferase CheR [Cycloclasticus sp.]|nr:protein-glutamate O-methyltransferase CheR [Cycloclasticus sp.]MBQ0789596.1 protein-glutamate O-methyltransferase CheR [Cycloclasticus sp.]